MADLVCDNRMLGYHVMFVTILLFKELLMSSI